MPIRRARLVMLLVLGASVAFVGDVRAGAAPDTLRRPAVERGVVWTPPERTRPALHALGEMRRRGVTAVRATRFVDDPAVLARADTLGLRLYVDGPAAYRSAAALRDSLDALARHVDRVVAAARRHPSVYAVGLAQYADTSVPAACDVLRSLADRVRERAPGVQTYYVTPFDASVDRCAGAVDAVLVDLRDAADPWARWSRWRTGSDAAASVGVGALGTWVRPGAAVGLRVPHSPQRQARHLETALTAFLEATRPAPPAVFVYRWSDRVPATAPMPNARRYGLLADDGTLRPAAEVVTGLFTGRQTVFAFPQGTPPAPPAPWRVLLGWAVVIAIALVYAQRPTFRRMAARYFVAHGFYRDALAEGREVMPDVSAMLWAVAAGAVGVVAAVSAQVAAPLPTTSLVLEALPAALQPTVAAWVEAPARFGLVAGAVTGGAMGVWMLLLVAVSRRWTPLTLGQALMLVAWPCWPAAGGLVAALVAATLTGPPAAQALAVVGAGGLVVSGAVVVRVARDYARVAGVPPVVAGAVALASPVGALLVATGTALTRHDVPLSLLWHLVTRA